MHQVVRELSILEQAAHRLPLGRIGGFPPDTACRVWRPARHGQDVVLLREQGQQRPADGAARTEHGDLQRPASWQSRAKNRLPSATCSLC